MSLNEVDRMALISLMDEIQVAEVLVELVPKMRDELLESLRVSDPALATCALEALR